MYKCIKNQKKNWNKKYRKTVWKFQV